VIRLNIQLADSQALNMKLFKPPFHQAKLPYAERAHSKRADCRSTQSHCSEGNSTHRKTTREITIHLYLCHGS
jgi:hypothetical protein